MLPKTTVANEVESTYRYDNDLGLPTKETIVFNGVSTPIVSTYDYDLSGRLTTMGYPRVTRNLSVISIIDGVPIATSEGEWG